MKAASPLRFETNLTALQSKSLLALVNQSPEVSQSFTQHWKSLKMFALTAVLSAAVAVHSAPVRAESKMNEKTQTAIDEMKQWSVASLAAVTAGQALLKQRMETQTSAKETTQTPTALSKPKTLKL